MNKNVGQKTDFKIKLVFKWLAPTHITFKADFCSTHLHKEACITVVSSITLNFVENDSVFAFWVKKISRQWPVHDTRSFSNTFSFIIDQ